jgi:branched-chain amino acid transport system substrate-binding protein
VGLPDGGPNNWEDDMKFKSTVCGAVGIALLGVAAFSVSASAEDALVVNLTYRTGAFAPNGIPLANGQRDYWRLVNKRGGIDGVMIRYEECETNYKTDKGVECYQGLKDGMVAITPNSTGITYKLIPSAPVDKVPVLSMGYGMSAAADGRWFPWVFNFPTTYWSQASALVKYVGSLEGGMDKLKGKKLGLIFLESSYGREPIPVFEAMAKEFGYEFESWSVPGKSMQDQRSQWRKIVRSNPDYVFNWGWGVMNSTAIQRASELGFPMTKFIGNWWSGTEGDARPAGEGAKGYRAANFTASGVDTVLHTAIFNEVYGKNWEEAKANAFGEILYNRGIMNAMLIGEAIRYAKKTHGKVTGEGVREGYENMDLTEARLAEIGLAGFTKPIKVSCADHENNGPVMVQEWDGTKWIAVSDWISPMRDFVRPIIEAKAVEEAAKLEYKMRSDCS